MNRDETEKPGVDRSRRRLLQLAATVGGSAVFGRALAVLAAEKSEVSVEMIRQAEWISGLELTDGELELMREGVEDLVGAYRRLRAIPLDNSVTPPLYFAPVGAGPAPETRRSEAPPPTRRRRPDAAVAEAETSRSEPPPPSRRGRPAGAEDFAFAPLSALGGWLRSGEVSSLELTRLYLDRLRRYDPRLHCVITLTEELALEQAASADRELAAGRDRGPLHGIPWGAKDLLAVPGYPTTWGAAPYRDQVRPEKAAVVERLERAGAVLVAKTSVGALAWGDVWFGGKTRNPWNLEQGSSGSSAGSAAATAAGLVGFALGTETWGSIVSPCTRCGVTGVRPTFGRVSRAGVMALSWSMDKVGPIARTVDDCARVLAALHGADPADPTTVERPFEWPRAAGLEGLRVGYVAELFEENRAADVDDEERRAALRHAQRLDREALEVLARLGIELVPVELPSRIPVSDLALILTAEAATVFDDLTRSGRDDELTRQVANAWPNEFRQGQTIPAVEYLRANRLRRLLMEEMQAVTEKVDVYVTPTYGGSNLLLTNLTGHPQVVVPNGIHQDGSPASITFTGRLWGESELLAVAAAYQEATGFHLLRPPLAEPDAGGGSAVEE